MIAKAKYYIPDASLEISGDGFVAESTTNEIALGDANKVVLLLVGGTTVITSFKKIIIKQ